MTKNTEGLNTLYTEIIHDQKNIEENIKNTITENFHNAREKKNFGGNNNKFAIETKNHVLTLHNWLLNALGYHRIAQLAKINDFEKLNEILKLKNRLNELPINMISSLGEMKIMTISKLL